MSKKMYVYNYLDVCEPGSGSYHEGGGLLVITSGYPEDAVPRGTGNYNAGGSEIGLPQADLIVPVPDDTEDVITVFADAGCC